MSEFDDEVLDDILFQTAILHQDYGTMSPKLIHHLKYRFLYWVGKISEMVMGKKEDDTFEKPDHWKGDWGLKKNG